MCVQNVHVLNIRACGMYNMQLLRIKGSNVCLYITTVLIDKGLQQLGA
jgi:hypothetical protein